MSFANFKKTLAKDKEHNIAIARKILAKQGKKMWYEKTHSYCYIVLRAVFYIYFKEFINNWLYFGCDSEITEYDFFWEAKGARADVPKLKTTQ